MVEIIKNEVQFINFEIYSKALKEVAEIEALGKWPIPIIKGKDEMHFSKELKLIVKKLYQIRKESTTIEEISMVNILLAFARSLTRSGKKYVRSIFNKIDETYAKTHFPNLYIYLKYTLLDLRKTLLVTHFGKDYNHTDNYYKILGYHRNIKKIQIGRFKSYEELLDYSKDFYQVFFVGHATTFKIDEEEEFLAPKHFDLVNDYKTEVIGFFNCGDKFINSSTMSDKFDIIFHDDYNVPDYTEFFLAKYLYEYQRTRNLFASIDQGKLAMWLKHAAQDILLDVRINGIDYFEVKK